jgi:hypothetical protein
VKPSGRRYLMESLPSGYPVLKAPGRGCREPGRVPSRVMRLGYIQHPSVPWVQDPDKALSTICREAAMTLKSGGMEYNWK